MKIAVLVPLFPPKWTSGTEIATYHLARHLAKRNHQVSVITTLDRGLPRVSSQEGFHVYRVPQAKLRFLGLLCFWTKVFWLLRKSRPDIIQVQGIGAGMPAYLAKTILKMRYVVWGRGSDVYYSWRFKSLFSTPVLRHADAVVALTEDMREAIKKTCNRDILVIPNGIELANFTGISKAQARRNLQIGDNNKITLFVGKLNALKGVKYLIEAMDSIHKKSGNAVLVLVGDGPERPGLESLAAQLQLDSHIIFAGMVPNSKVPEYLAASDVFVLPSLSEGFPISVLEAMAASLPVVTTKVRGLPEIIKDGENGFLVEPENPSEIAAKVLLLLEDDELRSRISANNRQEAKSFTWETIIQRLETVYGVHDEVAEKISCHFST